jgi:hypothetical protein
MEIGNDNSPTGSVIFSSGIAPALANSALLKSEK